MLGARSPGENRCGSTDRDIAGDELINLNDFAMFAVCFGNRWGFNGSTGCSNEALASSDLDRNGVIDLRDFAIFALNFGTE